MSRKKRSEGLSFRGRLNRLMGSITRRVAPNRAFLNKVLITSDEILDEQWDEWGITDFQDPESKLKEAKEDKEVAEDFVDTLDEFAKKTDDSKLKQKIEKTKTRFGKFIKNMGARIDVLTAHIKKDETITFRLETLIESYANTENKDSKMAKIYDQGIRSLISSIKDADELSSVKDHLSGVANNIPNSPLGDNFAKYKEVAKEAQQKMQEEKTQGKESVFEKAGSKLRDWAEKAKPKATEAKRERAESMADPVEDEEYESEKEEGPQH